MSGYEKPKESSSTAYSVNQGSYDAEEARYRTQQEVLNFGPVGPSLYESKDRPRRDVWATIAYLIVVTIATIGGIAAFAKTDSAAIGGLYSSAFYQNSTSCNVKSFQSSQSAQGITYSTDSFGSSFAASVGIWLPISVVIAIAFSLLYLYLFRKHAVKMVFASVIGSVVLSIGMAVISFATGAVVGGIILIIFGLVSGAVFWWIRDQLRLTGQLLAVAGKGLQECPGIILSAIGIKFAGIGIMAYFFAAFICALFVGQVQTNSARTSATPSFVGSDSGICRDVSGVIVDCCTHSTAGWAAFVCFITSIALLWTAQVVMTLKLYVVADTLSAWYFCPSGSTDPMYLPSARRGLRHGLTSSFGSICFAGLILALIKILRDAMNRAQDNAQGALKIICCILNCIAQCFLELLQQFTTFAVITTAITGKAFVPAAMDLFSMLKRNFLCTYSLWWIPNFTLSMTVFLITLSWSVLVFFSTYLQWKATSDAVPVALAVAAVAGGAAGFILNFIASLMLDGVDTIYICFAFDRDRKTVTHPEIHQIYEGVPTLKAALIENPDGGIAYGAPQQQHQVQYSAPPPYGAPPHQHQVQMYSAPPPYPGYAQQTPYSATPNGGN